jgi:predicted MFS family arabinose efflux permease
MVVWATTVGAVLGPQLLQSAADLAVPLGLPALAGPYLVTAAALTLAFVVIVVALRPDPLLLARDGRSHEASATTVGFRASLGIVRRSRAATYGLLALTVGHCAMVMVMVMTPVHMQHVDVTLRVIGLVISVHILGMYAFSPVVGMLTDRWSPSAAITVGSGILLLATVLAGTAAGDNTWQLGWGLFLLGLGWSFTLIAGSALLSVSVPPEVRPAVQGAGDTVMNAAAAVAGALAGVVVALGTYGWLNVLAAVLVVGLLAIGVSPRLRTPVRLGS